MKSLLNKIAKQLNGLNEIRSSLFFQSMEQKDKKDLYDAIESLNKLHQLVYSKIKK